MPTLPEIRLHWVDTLIVVGYLGALVAMGAVHARRQRNLTDFFLAGQEMRWLVVGMSLMAALNSGLDYLMQPSAMIQFGACILVANLTWLLLLLPYIFWVTVPMYRRLGSISAYAYLEQRFDVRVRTLAAVIFLLWRIGWMATALYVPALAISTATGGQMSVTTLTIVIGVVITVYTMLGGIRAVIWNDVIQYCIMFLGLAATVAVATLSVDGGLVTIVSQLGKVGASANAHAPTGAPTGLLSYFFSPMTATGFFIAILVSRITTYTSDQVMVQRFQTARSVTDARRGLFITAASDVMWMLLLCFVGLALYAYFESLPGGLPAWTSAHPDRLFPYFMARTLPVGLTGLVIAAILAASISSVDSAINSLTSVAIVDLWERLWQRRADARASRSDAEQRQQVFVSRIMTFGFGFLGIAVSLQVSQLGSLVEISNKIINSFTGPILGIYLLGMFTCRASSAGVLAGGTLGTLVTIGTAFQAEFAAAFNRWFGTHLSTDAVVSFLWPSTFGLVATLAIGYLASCATSARGREEHEPWLWLNVVKAKLPD